MERPVVAVKRYEGSAHSLRDLVELCEGFNGLRRGQRVLIKPNLVGWDDQYPMPYYGIYTTTRLVQDMVLLLKERGVEDIVIGEGSVYGKGFGVETGRIYEVLGYPLLARRYGVRLLDLLKEDFEEVDFGDFSLEMSRPALEADFLINMPVLKTHNQSILSLGLKNLKGCLSVKSRRLCHSPDHSLDRFLSMIVEKLRPSLTVIDGIYGLERGPFYVGRAVRMDALVAARDPLSADAAGAELAGFDPAEIPHLKAYADRHGRSLNAESLDLRGTPIAELRRQLKWDSTWREDNTGPRAWDRMGIEGVCLPKYDKTLCTGCSSHYSPVLVTIMSAYKGVPFKDIEILTGKAMRPSGRAAKTILVGNCMIKACRRDPHLKAAVPVKGCPPSLEAVQEALAQCGIPFDEAYYREFRRSLVERYEGKAGFEEGFYRVS